MKICDRIVKEAFNYWDGMLTGQEQEEISTHIRTCPHCEKRFAQARQIRQALRNLPKLKTSPHFHLLLHARMRREVNRKRALLPLPITGWAWQVPAYAAAAIILIAGGIFIDQVINQRAPDSRSIYTNSTAAETVVIPVQQTEQAAPSRIKNYVMQPIPMERLLSMNRRHAAGQQQQLERRPADTSRAGLQRPQENLSGVRQVSAPVQF
ncbi:zf-HC2 domain-containing protein [candidate division KSB1 bacterium]|nr:zf-HC2 domain-containing protein [candidate division KSB1 bacterium]